MEIKSFSESEIQQIRSETSGANLKIHFNNAGCSLPPDIVVNTVTTYLQEEAKYGGYETEYKYRMAFENVYKRIAELIHAEKDEIALVENASYAWGLAFNGIDFKENDEIITSEMEYVTNMLGFLNLRKSQGLTVKIIPNDGAGNFSLKQLEESITPQTKLIAITHIASTTGGVMPIAEIGQIARKHHILYLIDACQSIGQIPINVKEIGCDMLAVTGRKFLRAPRGTGFLYVRKEIQDKLKLIFMDGFSAPHMTDNDFKPRQDARRFELYEKNRALTLGLGKAVEYFLLTGPDRIWERIQFLSGELRKQLKKITGITVHDQGSIQCGIVTFTLDGIESSWIKARLAEQNINVSVGMAISTFTYMNRHHLKSVVRASLHYYNTEEEISRMCQSLRAMTTIAVT
jgi:cysteine desulfurase/selenocysteine lyase